MATYKKKLLDANGNVILPYTRSELVYHGTDTVANQVNSLWTNVNARMPLAGGTFTGNAVAYTGTYGAWWTIKNACCLNSAWADTGQAISAIYFIRQ